jgi:hypothetical protein
MYFSLDVRRARTGDCLLVHFGTNADPGLVVIDGGPRGVYAAHLKPRLEQLRQTRRLGPRDPLVIDLLMVSHVDDDHVNGILDLTKELIEAARARRPQPLQILSFWHNSFDTIIGNVPAELRAAFGAASFGAAATTGELPPDADLDDPRFDEAPERETMVDTLKVLASIEQGHRLRTDARALELEVNPHFGGKLILAGKGPEPVDVGRALTLTVVGPMQPELAKLQKKHDEWLAEQKEKGKPVTDALAAYVDRSVPNLSSIVVLAEADGKRMLLTGDARGDKILEGLALVGPLSDRATMHVDVLKVPHHGSANNVEREFFARITADHYVLSGDGEHGNPERETLQMLVDARGNAPYTVHLTYPVDEIDERRQADWEMEQGKEKARKKKRPATRVRPDWSVAQHGLAAFIDAHPGFGQKIKVVSGNDRHLIDLHDEVPF